MATRNLNKRSALFGFAYFTRDSGNTSFTPPTSVETTIRPQEAASTMAMQKASVRLVFRKIWPRTSTFRTSCDGTPPNWLEGGVVPVRRASEGYTFRSCFQVACASAHHPQ